MKCVEACYHRVVQRFLVALLVVLFTPATAFAAPHQPIEAAMQRIVGDAKLQHAIVAAEVYDLDTKRPLYVHNPATLMEAASTTKLLTNGTSLALLGPDFRYTTPVYRTGPIQNGTLDGDLVLVASGDPNLSQRMQPDGTLAFENEDHSYDGSYDTRAVPGDPLAALRELAAHVAKAGITHVAGRVVVDTSLFPDAGAEHGTGAVVSAICVNDNLVDVTLTPGAKPGDPTTVAVSPQTPYVTFVNASTTSAERTEPTIDVKDVTNADGTHTVRIVGTQPVGTPMLYAYRVPEPRRFARDAFTLALRDAGVTVDAKAPGVPYDHAAAAPAFVPVNLVAQHRSAALSEEVRVTLKVSDNLHADLQQYAWAVYVAHVHDEYVKAAFAQERQLLKGAGLDLSGAAQQDGLGTNAFFTPDFMVHYLAWARTQSWYPTLLRALPVMGVDGTLFDIQTASPARGKVFAKTGTWGSDNLLNEDGLTTKGLAGYITTSHGRHIAFAFYINRMEGKQSVDKTKDAAHTAGQFLGAMATATYLTL